MGASESRSSESHLLQVFSQQEKQKVRELFAHIVGSQRVMTEPFLKKYFPPWFAEGMHGKMFPVIAGCRPGPQQSQHVTEVQFEEFLAMLLKGTYSEHTHLICLMNGGKAVSANLGDLLETVFYIVQMFQKVTAGDTQNKTWQVHSEEQDMRQLASYLLDLTDSESNSLPQGTRSHEQVENWITKSPLFLKIFERVFNELFPIIKKDTQLAPMKSLLPYATNVDFSKMRTMLHPLSIMYINYHLPTAQQTEWRLLFSNVLHGDSFSQLTRFSCGKGPTVLLVRDKDGHIFGAYVTEGWDVRPQFYGSSECFLFSLRPHYGVYTSTGYNGNYMYLNQGQETLPNGLGLGGQLDYFGLWIDSTFNKGHSKAQPKCTTYGSPQLSKSPEFQVDALEIWAVGPEKKRLGSEDDEDVPVSVLDKDMSAKAILELAGRKQHSEGLRELEEEEGPMSEEMKKKMNTIPKMF